MKKLISVVLVLCVVLALASCGNSGNSSLEPSSGNSAETFVKPAQYASVLLITINPQFRLYLDENGIVLAVEAVNKDAQSIKDSITFEDQSFETVIETIVTTANNNGFVKADAIITFEIVESKETDEAKADILAKAEKKATDIASELEININVNISEIEPANDPTTSESESTIDPNTTETDPSDTPSTTETNPSDSPSTTETKPNNPTTSKPVHKHSFSAATCTEPKKCSCGAVEGAALGHDYMDGVCTRCNAKDPNYKPLTSVLEKQGSWKLKYLHNKELYSVSITICNPGKDFAGVGIGDPLSTLPDDMQSDPDIKQCCEEFNGEYYYVGRGDGDDIKPSVEGNTVTLTDSSGNKLVLTRTGENTLKCASAPNSFANISGISVGAVFTFVAE